MAGENAAAPAGGEEEGKGVFATIKDAIVRLFMAIFYVLEFIFNVIYKTFWMIGQCLEFIWYPIKERCSKCCGWCGNK